MGGSSLENRRMLKEFLVDEELPCCSSNTEFLIKKSYWNPRKPCKLRSSSSSAAAAAGRNRSKAASISISAVHKASDMVINAIKFFPFIKTTPTINNYLPRSISKKLLSSSCSNSNSRTNQVLDHPSVYKVKIKDILRWKSFRDITMEMEEIIPLPSSSSSSSMEFSCLPNQTMSSKFKDSTSSGSTMSSTWSGTDDEDLSQDKDCLNEDGPEFSKHSYLPQFPDQGTILSKRELQFNEEDQHSPVSVLDSPFHQEDEDFFFFQKNLAAIERRKCRLMQRIQKFENLGFKTLEERSSDYLPTDHHAADDDEDDDAAVARKKATELVNRVEGITAADYPNQVLLLDFFIDELTAAVNKSDDGEMLRLAESWLSNSNNYKEDEESEMMMKMEMKWFRSWNVGNFEEETRELGSKLEIMVLNDLIDEILSDFISIK